MLEKTQGRVPMAITDTETAEVSANEELDDLFKDAPITPDFSKMKKAELVAFYTEKYNEDVIGFTLTIEEFSKLKVAEMKASLKTAFPDPDALDSPEITGFDPKDVINATVVEVQGLENEDAAVAYILERADQVQFTYFQIGGALAEIQSKGWFTDYDDFWTFVESTFGFGKRKAQYLTQIYHRVLSCEIAWDDFKDIGWTKLGIIAGRLTPENHKQWLGDIKGLTFAEIRELVKDDDTSETGANSSLVTKKLSFHKDQAELVEMAIDKAKKDGSTDSESVAVEYICTDYLAGPGTTPKDVAKSGSASEIISTEDLKRVFETIVEQVGDAEAAVDAVMQAVDEAYTPHFPAMEILVNLNGAVDLDGDE